MKLYRPVKSNFKTQGFGENLACVKVDANGSPLQPFQVIPGLFPGTCPIGTGKLYPLLGMPNGHNGYDLAIWKGESVYHSGDFDGWMRTEVDNAGGIGVDIISNVSLMECTDGCPRGTVHHLKLRYWHLKDIVGFDEKQIKFGDLIGHGDSTGISSGDHVHWGFKWCNPMGDGIHEDNGYQGCINQDPYYENVFALDVLQVKQQALTAIDMARKVIFQVIQFLKGRL